VVETSAPDPLPEALDLGEWDRLKSDRVLVENFDFLRHQGFCVETDALRSFAAEHGLDRLRDRDPLTAVRRLAETLYDAFDYEPGVTDAESPIDLALSARRGVCQDFAHIMITLCRSWGIPARYVSGYLFTDREGGDRSDPDASHAWLEVFLPSTRWIGFDPTNNTLAGERHISAAIGRDYADVPPSRGVYKGEAESQLAVGVNVRRARPTAGEPEFMRLASPSFARGGGRRRPGAGASLLERQQQQQQQQ
jgi:transglutaminase-like putative cysteine protease